LVNICQSGLRSILGAWWAVLRASWLLSPAKQKTTRWSGGTLTPSSGPKRINLHRRLASTALLRVSQRRDVESSPFSPGQPSLGVTGSGPVAEEERVSLLTPIVGGAGAYP
jgi:hypothetical protein